MPEKNAKPKPVTVADKTAREFAGAMLQRIQQTYDDTTDWRAEREEDYAYENGLIGKENPDVPFIGSPDIRPQTAQGFKRQWMGDFVKLVTKPQNIVKFSGGGRDAAGAAKRQQEFANWVYKSAVKNFRAVVNAAAARDMGAPGNCVVKVAYDYVATTYTKVDQADPKLIAFVKATDKHLTLLRTQQQVSQHAVELAQTAESGEGMNPTEPPPGESAATAAMTPGAANVDNQVEQIEQSQLLPFAKKYGYDLTEDADKERAKNVLRQYRAAKDHKDVICAVVERAPFPLKFKVIDYCTDLIVPAGTKDIQEAPWVAELMVYGEKDLRDEESIGKFRNVDKVIGDTNTMYAHNLNDTADQKGLPVEAETFRQWRQLVQGLQQDSDLRGGYPVFEVHCWLRRDEIEEFNGAVSSGSSDYVRAVVDFCPFAQAEYSVLRMMAHPYDFDGKFNWPYMQCRFNDFGESFYGGKGIQRLISAFEKERIESRSAAVSRDIIQSSPIIAWNADMMQGETATPEERRTPGSNNIDVHGGRLEEVLKIFQYPDLAHPMHNDDARNLAFSKEMVGIGDGSQLPPTVEPPTAAQVQSVTVPMNAIKLWEMDAFLDMWSQLFEMAFLLLKQFYFADSPDGKKTYVDEQTDELREIAESDFQHDFIIKAGGDPSMNDQNMMMQSAVAWMQMFGMNPNFAWMVEPTEFGPDISQMMLPGVFAKKWLHKSQNPQQDRQQFLQMQASALAQRQANQQKRQGASQQAAMPGVGGKNFGSMRMGM